MKRARNEKRAAYKKAAAHLSADWLTLSRDQRIMRMANRSYVL